MWVGLERVLERWKGRTKCFTTADGPEMLEEHETWQLRVMIERPTMCLDEKNQLERWGLFACNVHIYVRVQYRCKIRIFMKWTEKHMDVKDN